MTEIFIHIGVHKTGTTAIQNTFSEYRELIFNSTGVFYPIAGCGQHKGHHKLALAIKSGGIENVSIINNIKLEAQKKGAEKILLSSEIFDQLTREQLLYLKQQLRSIGFYPKLLICLRKLPELIGSVYQQHFKQGLLSGDIIRYKRVLESVRKGKWQNLNYVHYDLFFKEVLAVFDEEDVEVISFEGASLNGGVAASLLKVINNKAVMPAISVSRSNESIDVVKASFIKPIVDFNYPGEFVKEHKNVIDPIFSALRGVRLSNNKFEILYNESWKCFFDEMRSNFESLEVKYNIELVGAIEYVNQPSFIDFVDIPEESKQQCCSLLKNRCRKEILNHVWSAIS